MSENAVYPVIKPAVGLKEATSPSDPHGKQRPRKKQRVKDAVHPVIERPRVFKDATSSKSDPHGKQRLRKGKSTENVFIP